MKNKMLVPIPIFVVVVAVIFIFISCTTTTDDNNDNNTPPPGGESYFTYDGTTYTLASGGIEDKGANTGPGESGYNLNFMAVSSGVDMIIVSGIGDGVYFALTSPNSTLASGTYTWSNTRTDFTLVDAIIGINLDPDTGTLVWAIGGTVTVSVNGNIYTVEFTLAMEDGKTVTGNYSGPAPVLEI